MIINEDNFSEYFFDIKTHKPQKGQVMACFRSVAFLTDPQLKKDVADLLSNKEGKILAAVNLVRKIASTTERDAMRVCREIAEDLQSGMSFEDIQNKEYKLTYEAFYYAKKEHIPLDDFHWTTVGIGNIREFFDEDNNRIRIRT